MINSDIWIPPNLCHSVLLKQMSFISQKIDEFMNFLETERSGRKIGRKEAVDGGKLEIKNEK